MPELTYWQYALLLLGAAGIGVSKSGFSGISMLHVVIYANVFGPKESTGVLLPMLIVGDVCAIVVFGKKADWRLLRTVVVPMVIGVVLGWAALGKLPEELFGLTIGAIILGLTALQTWRLLQAGDKNGPKIDEGGVPSDSGLTPTVPQNEYADRKRSGSEITNQVISPTAQKYLAATLGTLAGFTTMLANAAGPIVAIYFLLLGVPKLRFIGTGAWLFLCVNLFKVPFSASLGLITWQTLYQNLAVIAGIPVGILIGKLAVQRLPQRAFDLMLLAFTAIAAIKMMLSF